MKRSTADQSRLPLSVLLGFAFAGTLACATYSPAPVAVNAPMAPAAPAVSLDVPAGNALLAKLQARGVQIYACAAGKDGAFGWAFKSPLADLTDAAGAPAGKHFAGPTWEFTNGSNVVGEVVQKAPAQGGNIPWLLLKVKSAQAVSPWGTVAFVQRVETAGGAAPAAGCDAAHAGAEAQVPYTAAYTYWGTK